MTLQQLQYAITVDRFGSFAKAADELDITQPTLSKMISRLEEELDVRLFERSNRYIHTTDIGRSIIDQAQKTIREAGRIKEIVEEAKHSLSGELHMSVGPNIAPYILPQFIRLYGRNYPSVALSIEELRSENIAEALSKGRIDIAVAIAGNTQEGILEIPLYYEPFLVYLSENCSKSIAAFCPEELLNENMWIMRDAQCMKESAFSFCKALGTGRRVYDAGSIDTLIRVVDENGGFTIIPEMHLPFLSEKQRNNTRPLAGESKSGRKVSLYISRDYVREMILNSVISTIAIIIPKHMHDQYIKKLPLRL